jgi:hypothetical protein
MQETVMAGPIFLKNLLGKQRAERIQQGSGVQVGSRFQQVAIDFAAQDGK